MKEHKENAQEENSYEEALKILTPREVEVLELVGQGYTSKEVTEILSISINTVNTHRKNIKHKLNIRGRRSIVKWYWVNGGEISISTFSNTHYW